MTTPKGSEVSNLSCWDPGVDAFCVCRTPASGGSPPIPAFSGI
jgi:hypothetical protein